MARARKPKIKLLRGEKIMLFLIIIISIFAPISIVFTKAKLSESNINVERMKNKINAQQNVNDSLEMQINELASLDKIQDVAKEMGLSYNKDNITEVSEYTE